MKTLLCALLLAAGCHAAAIYEITYLGDGGAGEGFTAKFVAGQPAFLTTFDGSFGNFNRVVAGDGNPAHYAMQSDVTYGLPYFYYAFATIGLGPNQTEISFEFGTKNGPIIEDRALFNFSLDSITEGVTETIDGAYTGALGQEGPPVLTIANVAPEPATLGLLGMAGLAMLGYGVIRARATGTRSL
jgi:hypothetical protein